MATADASPPTGQSPSLSEPLLPSNSTPFPFSCACSNLTVDARVSNDLGKKIASGEEKELIKVYCPAGAEKTKLSGYATYHIEGSDQETASNDDSNTTSDDRAPSWRKCWLCGVNCYLAKGKVTFDEPVEADWITLDLRSGIIYGDDLDHLGAGDTLPFSDVKLDQPPPTSTFGRPPHHVVPTPYPAVSDAIVHPFIPPPHDPFFLPPPFIPSHPHLRDLCNSASDYLRESHARLEDEVKSYIALKAKEMRDLEDKVRGEVELLWGKYTEGPGQGEETRRGRSASTSRSRSRSRQRDEQPKTLAISPSNPLTKVATSPTSAAAPGASLLAQSLSANTFYGPRPSTSTSPMVKDEVDATIEELTKTHGKKDDDRAVAMSYVFSNLGDRMGGSSAATASQNRRRSSSRASGTGGKSVREDLLNKDSWIDEERTLATMLAEDRANNTAILDDEEDGRTPRPRSVEQLQGDKGISAGKSKGKERSKVTFEEPKGQQGEEAEEDGSDQEEYVFDFELDDKPKDEEDDQAHVGSHEPKPSLAHLPISRTRNMVEANLSRTFAADAPSHRAAWRRIEQNGSMYASLRRGSSDEEGDEESVDEKSISKLAVSVPVVINLPRQSRTVSGVPAYERKTSLSDREGVLVPPLIAAMKERGLLQQARKGSGSGIGIGVPGPRGRTENVEGRASTHRAASVSREREQVKSYAADPGAIFESLADERDDGPDEEEDEGEGTLRDGKVFVPPHVLARKGDKEALPDVGWRSMIND